MIKFVILKLMLLVLATSTVKGEGFFVARITFYADDARFGNLTASGKRAEKGLTVAAHPRYKFGTKLEIPELAKVFGDAMFEVADRGPAVTKASASGGKSPVIDVYVGSHSEVNRLKKIMPMYMKVYVR